MKKPGKHIFGIRTREGAYGFTTCYGSTIPTSSVLHVHRQEAEQSRSRCYTVAILLYEFLHLVVLTR